MNITFTNPEFLWLLLSIPLLVISHFFITKNLKASAWKFANFEVIQRITEGRHTLRNAILISKNLFGLLIKCLILIMLIFSAAGAVFWYYGQSSNTNFVLAIDASSSMLAQDFEPNRFEAAKEAANTFVSMVKGSGKLGVVSFSGTSFIEQDLSRDRLLTEESIKDVEIKAVGGTDLGEAIVTSTNLLLNEKEELPKGRAIILLTDGRSTTGTSVDQGIEYAAKNFVKVNTIGIGTEAGGGFANINLISTIDNESLKQIADKTGGQYFRAEDEKELRDAYINIAQTVRENISLNLQLPLLIFALAIMFIEYGLAVTKFRTLP